MTESYANSHIISMSDMAVKVLNWREPHVTPKINDEILVDDWLDMQAIRANYEEACLSCVKMWSQVYWDALRLCR